MGAINFIAFGKGESAQSAFNELVAQAEWQYGHDPYNGTISTTRLVKPPVQHLADEWSEDVREKAIEYAEAHGWGEKWESRALHCGKCGGTDMWAFYGWASC